MDQCEDREEGAPPTKTTDRTSPRPGPSTPPSDQRVEQQTCSTPTSEGPTGLQDQTQPDSTFKRIHILESLLKVLDDLDNADFKKFKWFLKNETHPNIPLYKLEDADRMDVVDLMFQTYNTDTQRVTQRILQKMNKYHLGMKHSINIPVSKERIDQCRRKLKNKLQQRFECVLGHPKTFLNHIYIELYITEGGATEVNQDHEVRQIERASRNPHRSLTSITCEDIFKTPPDRYEPIRTVLTKGVAGIGKTMSTQMLILDWSQNKANQDIHFMFPFTFRELNVLKEEKFSLMELVHYFFRETKEAGIWIFEDFQVVFILDGLDECRPPLDFTNTQILTDVTESASVDVLLMNLIRGNLLPSARLWITTRPAAANQIPAEYVNMVTEIIGFTDPQKEEYFRKRFPDEEQANTIISHMKASQIIHIMCHIPVFCWITASVLEDVLKTTERRQLPKTLTEMYIHFLVVQAKLKNIKYDGRFETDPPWSPETRKMIEALGKLAFEGLKKGNLVFYESDLTECGIDIRSASVYSGVFTEVFIEERGLYQDKRFCFIHVSVQEFLAALHVHQTYINTGVNLLSRQIRPFWFKLFKVKHLPFYRIAVDQALQSPNGHLDLFLRFLLGLSLQTNQSLLQGLVKPIGSSPNTNQETVEYIKKKISRSMSTEKSINLFHCLNELDDRSLVDQIQQYLRSGCVSTKQLSPAQWSALAFILLLSGKDLVVFDLKEYCGSEEGLLRLLPVIKASNKALLSGCNLSERSCEALSSILGSQSSSLTHVDLTNNDLKDSGVMILSDGLKSPGCRLDTLRLSGCLITEEGCSSLVSALKSNPSHLRELDLSYNHPGASGQELSALVEDPHTRLDTVRLEPSGIKWLTPGPRKYFCELTLDPNTANEYLKLSENNKIVERVYEVQSYPDHQDRFEFYEQVMCSTGLTGRCYWEVQWSGHVSISVSFGKIRRKGNSEDCVFGRNDQSWSLECSRGGYKVWHKNTLSYLHQSSSSSFGTVSVYVDCPAGSVSFFSGKLIHLHTFRTTFTEPLFGGFALQEPGSTVCLRVSIDQCLQKLKNNLRQKFECVSEGITKGGRAKTFLNQIYIELYMTEGGATEVNQEHEVRQIERSYRNPHRPLTFITCEDIFKTPPDRHEPIRTVLTKGVASIGKTMSAQKLILDWSQNKANQDIHFMFPFTFRELNVLKQETFSLIELVHYFFKETREAGIWIFEDFQVVFILDGLDECRPPLDFTNTQILTDVTESASMDVLLMNLIRGNLLPSARLWITTRPAAANQIPAEYVDMVTEIMGFTDPQKEEYFRKRFPDEEQANTIISHVKASRAIRIMCHIPVFCWITASVLEDVLKTTERRQLPKTLTEMYIHFLVVQAKLKNIKYDGRCGTDPHWSPETRKMIEALGKLAFEGLKKGNLVFYESDLTECGIDIRSASVYSGVFTEVFIEERGLYQDKRFCFIHLSVQEFLAALHVHQTYINTGVNLLSGRPPVWSKLLRDNSVQFYQIAVDQALQSPNGHLDMFLRFLLGLSLQTNHRLLQGLLEKAGSSSKANQETAEYIKKMINDEMPVEKSINLFHCLNELGDRSLVDQIQHDLKDGDLDVYDLSPAQWSALVFMLLSSDENLDEFDLNEYSSSEKTLLNLLPVVKSSNKAVLTAYDLSDRGWEGLSSVLRSPSSNLRHLDISTNDLENSGLKILSDGLKSPDCKLESLRLSVGNLSETTCEGLSSVLRSQFCRLTYLDLNNTDLKDSGLKILSEGLRSPNNKMETLRLSGCLITEEGCSSLVAALTSHSSHLRLLDLSYNHPGTSEQKLRALVEDPHWTLDTLSLEPSGVRWLKPGLRKYSCDLILDPNTANEHLKLSEKYKKVEHVKEVLPYPDHSDRFENEPQLMSATGLTGRCYWEVEWSGEVIVSVSYRGIKRKGSNRSCRFGRDDQSWCLVCDEDGYYVWHNNKCTDLPQSSSFSSSSSGRVSVYVDCPAGSLSFYRVSSDKLVHLQTFRTTFTEPIFGGFGLRTTRSSVTLCDV